MSRASRWWFLRKVARVLLSGFDRVEFTDFWLGDQLCSLTFPLGNIYFIACSYTGGFGTHSFQKCSGKYLMGIMFYVCYQLWRHNGGHGTSFTFFCLLGTIYSTYNSAWARSTHGLVLLRPHARFMFLREELLYSSHIPFYYLAIITNVILRFTWILYIPTRGPSAALRTWLVALLEVLRRSQWNVYRLENEHLGNMDQYRITREVPLPYSFDEIIPETDVGDEDDEPQTRKSIHSSKSKRG
ncbi:EXS family-domain-containing protein [Russula aff. rugulosa BPL654]|nr:EXS family-domain-containing protein [Russula aff. rugulosa BPL654]